MIWPSSAAPTPPHAATAPRLYRRSRHPLLDEKQGAAAVAAFCVLGFRARVRSLLDAPKGVEGRRCDQGRRPILATAHTRS